MTCGQKVLLHIWLTHMLHFLIALPTHDNVVCAADPAGRHFAAAVQQELERINAFYEQQEQRLEVGPSPCNTCIDATINTYCQSFTSH